MTAITSSALSQPRLLAFLRQELAPRPGRLNATLRTAACCALVVAIAMLYQIPEAAYTAYVVILINQREYASTLLTGLISAAAATVGFGLSLAFYMLDASEPALRLPIMAIATFLGMFLARTLALGPAAFLVGFLLVITQTIIDTVPNLEALTRLILWLWVVIMLPVAVTVLANLLTGQNPATLARDAAVRIFDTLAGSLRSGDRAALTRCQPQVLELMQLRQHAGVVERRLRASAALDASLIEKLGELVAIATRLPPELTAEVAEALAQACITCRDALSGGHPPKVTPSIQPRMLDGLSSTVLPPVVAFNSVVASMADALSRRAVTASAPVARRAAAVFVPDAFTNQEHVRFALKTAVAAMTAYIIYNAVDWQGIRTSVITCFFVALGTVGETVHKLSLRLGGAVLGGLAGGLCVVFLLPWMTDIGQLSLLIAFFSGLCGWVALSSERLAYGGMQMAFAFFLTVLHGYGPTDDLTAPRDRVAGILLGNVLMSLVFSVVWPISVTAQARNAIARAMRALSKLLGEPATVPELPRIAVTAAMARARQLVSISLFEAGFLSGKYAHRALEEQTFEDLERVAASVNVVAAQPAEPVIEPLLKQQDLIAAQWLSAYADSLEQDGPKPPWPQIIENAAVDAGRSESSETSIRSAIESRNLLMAQMQRLAVDEA